MLLSALRPALCPSTRFGFTRKYQIAAERRHPALDADRRCLLALPRLNIGEVVTRRGAKMDDFLTSSSMDKHNEQLLAGLSAPVAPAKARDDGAANGAARSSRTA